MEKKKSAMEKRASLHNHNDCSGPSRVIPSLWCGGEFDKSFDPNTTQYQKEVEMYAKLRREGPPVIGLD
jgi:hypothetical protein